MPASLQPTLASRVSASPPNSMCLSSPFSDQRGHGNCGRRLPISTGSPISAMLRSWRPTDIGQPDSLDRFCLVTHLTSWAVLTRARQFYWLTTNAWVMGGNRSGHCRGLPVQRAQIPLSRRVPGASELCWRALARRSGQTASLAARHQTRSLLRRLLLVPDAFDVCCRHGQHRLDAGSGRGHGGGKELAAWPPPYCTIGRSPAAIRALGRDCGRLRLSARNGESSGRLRSHKAF